MAASGGWSTQADDWATLRSNLKGADWKSTWLENLYQDSVLRSAGVYMICVSHHHVSLSYNLPPELSTVIYVGKSSNLQQRFRQHAAARPRNILIDKYHNLFRRLQFTYTLVATTLDLSADQWTAQAEHSLVVALDPPANRNIPTAKQLTGRIGQPQPAA